MGAWGAGIESNDTAEDLKSEYAAAFYRYDVEEALKKIDAYVRAEMFDETDEEEWCNYIYSLANFMWKKGILTDSVKDKAIEMIDSGFGLELWEEEGAKALNSRKRKLAEFKEKLLSPQPPKKKIRLNIYPKRIFNDGDIIAVQLQTAGKQYTMQEIKPVSEKDFQAFDGKYVLMQLVECFSSRISSIVPEVKDYWACFRLFDGVYDTVPENIDVQSLKEALMLQDSRLSSGFSCESSMVILREETARSFATEKICFII